MNSYAYNHTHTPSICLFTVRLTGHLTFSILSRHRAGIQKYNVSRPLTGRECKGLWKDPNIEMSGTELRELCPLPERSLGINFAVSPPPYVSDGVIRPLRGLL
uniref:Uncharacterized protein n=1 Tax=Gadus morhua TaxID=8049 RepID=A0A8C5ALI0_GADMO